eukprot:8470253-Ditylum_brightwellii.AAC.1
MALARWLLTAVSSLAASISVCAFAGSLTCPAALFSCAGVASCLATAVDIATPYDAGCVRMGGMPVAPVQHLWMLRAMAQGGGSP